MTQINIIVVGAGVAGLTTALLLSRTRKYRIVIAAKHMPGDFDIEYASPWAGANYMPTSQSGTKACEWEKDTWAPLAELAQTIPGAGIHFQECEIHTRAKDVGTVTATWFSELLSPNPWYKDVVPNFRVIPKEALPSDVLHGKKFTSVCINTAIYLPWLVSQCLQNEVVFKRATYTHIDEAATAVTGLQGSGKVDVVVNCTGLGASKLGGVQDNSVVPARGQIVLVRNEANKMINVSGTDDGPDEACYVMTRAAGGGTILGGCYQKESSESQPDANLAIRIMKRAVARCPGLTNGRGIENLDIVKYGIGLRPVREDGPRVEVEHMQGYIVVHNYGHGGAGYQSSYGCGQEVVRLVARALEAKAKL